MKPKKKKLKTKLNMSNLKKFPLKEAYVIIQLITMLSGPFLAVCYM